MTSQPIMIEGRVVHKTSNALQMRFNDGPGEPIAVGLQGGGDGKGKKLGVLFGFKNGGTGNHTLTFTDGTRLGIASKDLAPSVFTRADGSEPTSVGTVTVRRGETSVAVTEDGTEILHFLPDPDGATTPELFRLVVTTPSGEELGRLDVIRKVAGWSVMRAIDAAEDLYVWWDRAGQPMKVPLLGTRLTLSRPPTPIEREVLLAACVDMAIGLRPYVSDMG